jgi:hypothetical protein
MRAAARAKSKLGVLRGFAGPPPPPVFAWREFADQIPSGAGGALKQPQRMYPGAMPHRAAFQTGSLTPLATARLANPRNLRDNNNLPSLSGRQQGKDSVQLC